MRKLLRRTAALTLALLTFAAGTVRADVVQRGASAATTAAVQAETAADGGAVVDQSAVGVSESTTATVTQAVASHGSGVNTGEVKVVTSTLFGGDELMLVAPRSASQMMSFVVTTKSGKVIVFDGGTEHDTEHLKEVLRAKGGRVSAWFITHPHSDHVGALTKILQDANSGITIDAVYYNFQPQERYNTNEAYRADMVAQCRSAIETLPESARHTVHKGDNIAIDDVTVNVMNDPYLSSVNSINNSSIAYRLDVSSRRVLFLGDMGVQAGNQLVAEYANNPGALQADIVQMAHHGQQGVGRNVYEVVKPTICLWPTPIWLWENNNGGGLNSGNWRTLEVRGWMRQLGVKTHVVAKDGDQVLR